MWAGIIMAAIAAASAIYKGAKAHKQNKLAKAIHPDDPVYKENEYAKANLGLAQQLYNGRMAGASDLERNIQTTQANTISNVNRNATNSSQALALAAASQGQTNESLNQLGIMEQQNRYNMLGNLTNANNAMVMEGDKKYADLMRKYNNDVQAKTALKAAADANTAGVFSDLTSAVGAFAGSGAMGGSSTPRASMPTGGGNMAVPGNTSMIGLPASGSMTSANFINPNSYNTNYSRMPTTGSMTTGNMMNPYQYNWGVQWDPYSGTWIRKTQ